MRVTRYHLHCFSNLEAPTALEATREHMSGAETWLLKETQKSNVLSGFLLDSRDLHLRPIHLVLHCAWAGQVGFATDGKMSTVAVTFGERSWTADGLKRHIADHQSYLQLIPVQSLERDTQTEAILPF